MSDDIGKLTVAHCNSVRIATPTEHMMNVVTV